MDSKIIIIGVALMLAGIAYFVASMENTITTNDILNNPYAWVTSYVTPSDKLVTEKTEEILGSSYDNSLSVNDVYKLQRWIAINIQYEVSEPEYPHDVLQDYDGDCYGMSSLLLSMIWNEDGDACSYMLLIDVKEDNSNMINKHSAVLTVFPEGIIISDPTIGSRVNTICSLASPEEAIDRLIDSTTADWYLVTNAVSFSSHYEFIHDTDFFDFAEQQIVNCGG